ncbi:MAG: UDP-2,3-diacylglucosamine diphosphatase [Nitrospirae bacterium]|nr:UDP-2,3-diacylglucosamine diphosphatase [Nitrospirota bacterium]
MKYRTIWISDIHLGTRGCQAERLLHFLRNTESETLFLVGDIIDFWALKRSWYWPESHNTIVQKILRKARHGTRVVYLEGNHDPIRKLLDFFLDNPFPFFGNIHILKEAVHTTRDGRCFLVLHGDRFDALIRCAPLLVHLGDKGYDLLVRANRTLHSFLSHIGIRSEWSLSRTVKSSVKSVLAYIESFESQIAREVQSMGLDGAVCGHIHKPAIKMFDSIVYHNDGDWVESCTALVEHQDGRMELVNWHQPEILSGTDPPNGLSLLMPAEEQEERTFQAVATFRKTDGDWGRDEEKTSSRERGKILAERPPG